MKNWKLILTVIAFSSSVPVLATPVVPDGSVSTAKIANLAVTTAKIADAGVTQAKRVALGQQLSSSSGVFTSSSSSFTDVTNLSVSVTTTGRPVFVGLVPDGDTSNPSSIGGASDGSTGLFSVQYQIVRGATTVGIFAFAVALNAGSAPSIPCASLSTIDAPVAGTYTYKIQGKVALGASFNMQRVKLVAYEL